MFVFPVPTHGLGKNLTMNPNTMEQNVLVKQVECVVSCRLTSPYPQLS